MNDDMFGKLVVSYMTDLHNGVLQEDKVLNLIRDVYDLKMTGYINNEQDTKNLFREQIHCATINEKGGLKQ